MPLPAKMLFLFSVCGFFCAALRLNPEVTEPGHAVDDHAEADFWDSRDFEDTQSEDTQSEDTQTNVTQLEGLPRVIDYPKPLVRQIFELVDYNERTGNLFIRGDANVYSIKKHPIDLKRLRYQVLIVARKARIRLKINFQIRLLSLIDELPDPLPRGIVGGYDKTYKNPSGGIFAVDWNKNCLKNSGPAHDKTHLKSYLKTAERIHKEVHTGSPIQTVVVAFSYTGCDKTGHLVASYMMHLSLRNSRPFNMKEFYADNTRICGSGMFQCYHDDLETMCKLYLDRSKIPYMCETGARCHSMTEEDAASRNLANGGVRICEQEPYVAISKNGGNPPPPKGLPVSKATPIAKPSSEAIPTAKPGVVSRDPLEK